MMKWLFGGIVILSTIFAIFNRTMEEVSNAALNECQQAVEFMLTLLGSICLWSGFMKIAERSGLTKLLAKALSPLTRLLFPSIPKESKAMQAISMNITANLLGLGNAATPLGITAMKELKQYAPPGLSPDTISHSMTLFILLNTASIQLLPTTIATMRFQTGAQNPLDILPAILLSSLVSVCVGLILAQCCKQFCRFPHSAATEGV